MEETHGGAARLTREAPCYVWSVLWFHSTYPPGARPPNHQATFTTH